MIVSLCYLLLCLITVFVTVNCVYIARKTSSLILCIPIAVMYYWSIYGAWSWIPMKLSGGVDFYETVLFAVDVDGYYLASLFLYSVFIAVFTFYVRRVAKRQIIDECALTARRDRYKDSIDILWSSKLYKIIVLLLLGVFIWYSMRDLAAAANQGVSAYQLSRFDSTLSGIGSMIAFFGDTFLYLAIPLVFSRRKIKRNLLIFCELSVYFAINLLLGNRNTMLCGLVMSAIICVELYGIKKTLRLKYVIIGTVVLVAIQLISFVRGLTIIDILSGNYNFNFWEVLGSTTRSHEQHAAQISMYGVLRYDVSPTYGTSILFLISTLIPSFLGFPRPERIYNYYVLSTINSKPDIGVTLHHATAWFLNFGYLGIIIGALVWGYVLKYFYIRRGRYIYFYAAVVFSSVSIQMIRDAGPEAYKGGLLLATVIPMLIARYCLRKKSVTV